MNFSFKFILVLALLVACTTEGARRRGKGGDKSSKQKSGNNGNGNKGSGYKGGFGGGNKSGYGGGGGKIVVAAGGKQISFGSIQSAVDHVAKCPSGSATIEIPVGTFKEKLVIPQMKASLRIVGKNRQSTIITNDDYSGKTKPRSNTKYGTSNSYTVMVKANKVTIENLTIRNTAGRVAQAVALYVTGDQFIMKNSNLLGNQDTLCAGEMSSKQSRQYYKNCYIEGTTDFIFSGGTAVFEGCQIKSLANSYITAASTPQGNKYGFVFRNCKLEANGEAKKVYLGRPWRPYAKTVFLNTKMGSHIVPAGWDNWRNPSNERTAFYAEYNTQGVSVSQRVKWSKQLNANEAKQYSNENIFKCADGSTWSPR